VIRQTVASVSLDAIAHNLRAIRRLLARRDAEVRRDGETRRDAEIIAVVKANAYGHGAAPVAQALEAAGATMVACAE